MKIFMGLIMPILPSYSEAGVLMICLGKTSILKTILVNLQHDT